MKKLFAVSALLLSLTACSTPEQKVEALKEEKAAVEESSGYTACLGEVAAAAAISEECPYIALRAAGYEDRTDCMTNFETPPCTDMARYKAEVKARNDCMEAERNTTGLTVFDCQKMLMDAQ